MGGRKVMRWAGWIHEDGDGAIRAAPPPLSRPLAALTSSGKFLLLTATANLYLSAFWEAIQWKNFKFIYGFKNGLSFVWLEVSHVTLSKLNLKPIFKLNLFSLLNWVPGSTRAR